MKVLLLENIHPSAINSFKKSGFKNIEVVKGAISEKEHEGGCRFQSLHRKM